MANAFEDLVAPPQQDAIPQTTNAFADIVQPSAPATQQSRPNAFADIVKSAKSDDSRSTLQKFQDWRANNITNPLAQHFEDLGDLNDKLKANIPEIPQIPQQYMDAISAQNPLAGAAIPAMRGAANVGIGAGNFMTSPAGLATAAANLTPAGPVVNAYFAGDMANSAVNNVVDLSNGVHQGPLIKTLLDPKASSQDKWQSAEGEAFSIATPGLISLHALSGADAKKVANADTPSDAIKDIAKAADKKPAEIAAEADNIIQAKSAQSDTAAQTPYVDMTTGKPMTADQAMTPPAPAALAGKIVPDQTNPLKQLPDDARVEYMGSQNPVLQGIGKPIPHWKVTIGDGKPEVLTAEGFANRGFSPPNIPEPAPAKYIGEQEAGDGTSFPLYNLTAPVGGHPVGDTLGLDFFKDHGFDTTQLQKSGPKPQTIVEKVEASEGKPIGSPQEMTDKINSTDGVNPVPVNIPGSKLSTPPKPAMPQPVEDTTPATAATPEQVRPRGETDSRTEGEPHFDAKSPTGWSFDDGTPAQFNDKKIGPKWKAIEPATQESNAIQEQGPAKMDVQSAPGDGGTVGEGNPVDQGAAGSRQEADTAPEGKVAGSQVESPSTEGSTGIIPATKGGPVRGYIANSGLGGWAQDVLSKRGPGSGALNTVDPQLMAAYAVHVASMIENGVTDGAKLAASLAQHFGDAIKDEIPDILKAGRSLYDARDNPILNDMKPEDIQGTIDRVNKAISDEQAKAKATSTDPDAVEARRGVYGATNAYVDAQRAKLGLPAIGKAMEHTFGDAGDEANLRLAKNPEAASKLVDDINSKGNDRPLNDADQILLTKHMAVLSAKVSELGDKIVNKTATPDESTEYWHARDQLDDAFRADKIAGATWGRAGNIRQALLAEDLSFGGLMRRLAAEKGDKPISPEEIETLKQQAAEGKKLSDSMNAKDAEVKADESGKAIDAVIKGAKDKGVRTKPNVDALKKAIDSLRENAGDGTNLEDLHPLVRRIAEEVVRNGTDGRENVLDAVHKILQEHLDKDITRRQAQDAIGGYGDWRGLSADEVKRKVAEYAGELRRVSALQDIDSGKAPLKTGFERRPLSSEEVRLSKEVEEAKKRSGLSDKTDAQKIQASMKDADRRIAELERQIRMEEPFSPGKKPAGPTSPELDAKRAEINRLKEQREYLRQKLQPTPEPKTPEQLRLDQLDKQINDLRTQIRTETVFPKGRKAQASGPEIDARLKQIADLKFERNNLREKLQPTGYETIAERGNRIYRQMVEKKMADLQKRLDTKDFGPRPPRNKLELDPESQKLQVQYARLRQQIKNNEIAARMQNRLWWEKMLDGAADFNRAWILTSLNVFGKLGWAAVSRLVMNPIQDMCGSILRQVPVLKDIYNKAPRHGQGFIGSIYSQAIYDALTKGMKGSKDTAMTGGTDRDLLNGHGEDYGMGDQTAGPAAQGGGLWNRTKQVYNTLIKGPGRSHAVVKAPIKEFEASVSEQLRNKFVAEHGQAMTDEKKADIDKHVYEDSAASVLLQKNEAVSTLRNAEKRWEAPKPGNPHPVLGKLAATGSRIGIPIRRVPANLFMEGSQYGIGLGEIPHIGSKLLSASKELHPEDINPGEGRFNAAVRKMVDNLTEDQADLLAKHLNRGLMGAALATLGIVYYKHIGGNPIQGESTKNDNRVKSTIASPLGFSQETGRGQTPQGRIRIGDVSLSKAASHSAPAMMLNFAATAARVANERRSMGPYASKGYGLWLATGSTIKDLPGVKAMTDNLGQFLEPGQKMTAIKKSIAGMVVPPVVSQIADATDTDKSGNSIKRNPTTVGDYIEERLPYYKNQLPRK